MNVNAIIAFGGGRHVKLGYRKIVCNLIKELDTENHSHESSSNLIYVRVPLRYLPIREEGRELSSSAIAIKQDDMLVSNDQHVCILFGMPAKSAVKVKHSVISKQIKQLSYPGLSRTSCKTGKKIPGLDYIGWSVPWSCEITLRDGREKKEG